MSNSPFYLHLSLFIPFDLIRATLKHSLTRVSASLAADADRSNINYYNAYFFAKMLNKLLCHQSDDWWPSVMANPNKCRPGSFFLIFLVVQHI